MNQTLALQHDTKAQNLAKTYLQSEGTLLVQLIEMAEHGVFAFLGYSGVYDYCSRKLGFSKQQSYYFKSVAEASVKVPELKDAVVQGEITLSEARRIAPVLTPQNHEGWIRDAKTLPQTELEKKVAEANPKAKPRERIKPVTAKLSELKVAIDEKTEANLKSLQDTLSQKLQRPASLQEVIAWATEVTREKFDAERKAQRSILRKTKSSGNPKPGRHPIPAAIENEVILRDGNQCTFKGPTGVRCQQRRFLHLHHFIEVAVGGLNEVSNLTLHCSQHHRLVHRFSQAQADK